MRIFLSAPNDKWDSLLWSWLRWNFGEGIRHVLLMAIACQGWDLGNECSFLTLCTGYIVKLGSAPLWHFLNFVTTVFSQENLILHSSFQLLYCVLHSSFKRIFNWRYEYSEIFYIQCALNFLCNLFSDVTYGDGKACYTKYSALWDAFHFGSDTEFPSFFSLKKLGSIVKNFVVNW